MTFRNDTNELESTTQEISIKELLLKTLELWNYLKTKWAKVFFISILGSVIGLTYALITKPVFLATTIFALEDDKSSSRIGSLAGLASMAGVDIGGSGGGIFEGENILQLYTSRSMIEKTLLSDVIVKNKKQLLLDYFININNWKDKWKNKSVLTNFKFSASAHFNQLDQRFQDSVLMIAISEINKKNLTVSKPDKKLSIVRVDVKSKDEFFAKSFNDELVKNVNQFYINTKTRKSLHNIEILQHKTDSVRYVMNGAIFNAVSVTDATPNLNPTKQVIRIAPMQKAQFSAETNKAILAEMVKNLEISKMSLLKETPLIQVIDSPIYPLEENKVSKVKAVIIGGVLLGFFALIFFIVKRFFSIILN
ncbi:lipopolysaccharide biosynthesis protein [Pedobacter aquatilis]|uniref:lipopolysaccharide biosynthesis protein n=1 Tax=Pedobacter aquatilis TaxID=351343 RepID=UPI00292FE068|nr:lipopolysaccharide biosynthesis protein [Pedobacter aquatilis]